MQDIEIVTEGESARSALDCEEPRGTLWPEMVYTPVPVLALPGLSDRLRSERARVGLGQKELANAAKVTRMTLYRYERGMQLPSVAMLAAAQSLGLDAFFILSGAARAVEGDGREFFLMIEGLNDRLRIERERLGLRQVDLAAAARFTRLTQMGYEKGLSFPPLEYFFDVQNRGVDLRFVLFGRRSAVLIGWQDAHRLEHALAATDAILHSNGSATHADRARALLKLLMPATAPG